MIRILAAVVLSLSLAASQTLAADRLSAGEIRKVILGSWSGNYKKASLVLSIAADGTVEGRYGGIPATGSWTTKRTPDGDRILPDVQIDHQRHEMRRVVSQRE